MPPGIQAPPSSVQAQAPSYRAVAGTSCTRAARQSAEHRHQSPSMSCTAFPFPTCTYPCSAPRPLCLALASNSAHHLRRASQLQVRQRRLLSTRTTPCPRKKCNGERAITLACASQAAPYGTTSSTIIFTSSSLPLASSASAHGTPHSCRPSASGLNTARRVPLSQSASLCHHHPLHHIPT